MELVCPLCNGLTSPNIKCAHCSTMMIDDGMVSDYVGDYSPYELTPRVRMANDDGMCTHLLHCPDCGKESYAVIQSEWH